MSRLIGGFGLIRKWTATRAAAHDGARLEDVLDGTNTASDVWADTAYRSAKNEAMLSRRGFVSRIHRKKPQGRPTPDRVRIANEQRSSVRSSVEHVFARQKGPMGLFMRTIDIARARVKIGLANGSYQSAQSVMDTVSGAGLAGVQTTAMEVGQMASSTVSDQIAFWRSGDNRDMMGVTLHDGDRRDRGSDSMAYAPMESGITTRTPIKGDGPLAGFAVPLPRARTYRAWGSIFGGGANFVADVNRGAPGANLGYYGGLLGVDYQIAPNALIGVALGGSA